MRDVQVSRWADCAAGRWRNGGGVTYELACAPRNASVQEFDWRLSLAEVARPGAFSEFPGVDRVIMLVDGGTMTLTVDGNEHVLRHLDPFRFSGGSDVYCTPVRASRDLNLMTRRDRCSARIVVTAVRGSARFPERREQLFVPVDYPMTIVGPDSPQVLLACFDVLHTRADHTALAEGRAVRVDGSGHVAVIEIESPRQDRAADKES